MLTVCGCSTIRLSVTCIHNYGIAFSVILTITLMRYSCALIECKAEIKTCCSYLVYLLTQMALGYPVAFLWQHTQHAEWQLWCLQLLYCAIDVISATRCSPARYISSNHINTAECGPTPIQVCFQSPSWYISVTTWVYKSEITIFWVGLYVC